MAYYRDIREYLAALDAAGKLVRIRRAINKDTQLSPLVRLQYRGLPEEGRRAFLFENVTDSNGKSYHSPVAIGALAGSGAIYALGLQCPQGQISEKLSTASLNPIAPTVVPSGPVQEETHLGSELLRHGGLGEFPIPIATPGFDVAPYITAPYFVSRDPDTGVLNVGMYRAMVKGPARTGVNFYAASQGGYIHYSKCKERGRPLEAAIVIGGPPSLGYVAVSSFPVDLSEFAVAGAIAGEPLELVRCKTVDLEVPAHAEIVIEGLVPTHEVELEAPFGETSGYVGPMDMNPFFNVTCISHRHDPVWLATISQYPPSESSKIRQFAGQTSVYRHLRHSLGMSHVLDVAFLEEVSSGPIVAVQVDKIEPEQVWETLEAVNKRWVPGKIVIVVDKDVNVHDFASVFWAMLTRAQPHRDYRIKTQPARHFSDYSLEPLDKLTTRRLTDADPPTTSRLLVDATIKWPLPPTSLPRREFMEDALRIWREEGLPDLKLKEPWSGVNLGFWNEEHERHARAAAAGNYYLAGDDYAMKRRPA